MRLLAPLGLVLAVVSVAGAAAPVWDVSGTWKGFVGDLTLVQSAGGSIGGTFQMKVGCTESYRVTGTTAGAAVSLALSRSAGAGDTEICAGTQTLKGGVEPGGGALSLALANAHQSMPPARFEGRAWRLAHARTLKLSFVGHLGLHVVVAVADGYPPCSERPIVRLQRLDGSVWRTVAEVRAVGRSTAQSSATAYVKDLPRAYRAVLPGAVLGLHTCGAVTTPPLLHRH